MFAYKVKILVKRAVKMRLISSTHNQNVPPHTQHSTNSPPPAQAVVPCVWGWTFHWAGHTHTQIHLEDLGFSSVFINS